MPYQVRHKEFGLFQGEFLGMGFWHPMSETPEQGICEFPSKEDAQKFIDWSCSDEGWRDNWEKEDFTIEPFDSDLNVRLLKLN